jgi:hypothetical protein
MTITAHGLTYRVFMEADLFRLLSATSTRSTKGTHERILSGTQAL